MVYKFGIRCVSCRICSTASELIRILDKYRPESKAAKKERLRKRAKARAAGKPDMPTKRKIVLRFGVNTVTKLVEQKKARLVCIASDVDPIEVWVSLPFSCTVNVLLSFCFVRVTQGRDSSGCSVKIVGLQC